MFTDKTIFLNGSGQVPRDYMNCWMNFPVLEENMLPFKGTFLLILILVIPSHITKVFRQHVSATKLHGDSKTSSALLSIQ